MARVARTAPRFRHRALGRLPQVGTGKPTLTWPQSVDEALCFGWIDGIRKRVDDERYVIRFTRRKRTSTWSAVNIRRVAELEALGQIRKAGRAAFAARRDERSAIYAYERRPDALEEPYATTFKNHQSAWKFFESQPAGYRRTSIAWVMSAKREATREKRLARLIQDSAQKKRLSLLARTNGTSA